METRRVRVCDIVKHPTALGSKCKLLKEMKMSPYREAEETLADALTSDIGGTIHICKSSCHCKGFHEEYAKGNTPFIDDDPIILSEHGGKYIVVEGKHRICMAIRLGIKTVQASVQPATRGWFAPLSARGTAGEFSFACPKDERGADGQPGRKGYLWIQGRPYTYTGFEFLRALDCFADTKGETKEPLCGISYSVSVRKRTAWRPSAAENIEAKVAIRSDFEGAKVWLFEHTGRIALTLCRFGIWEERHMEEARYRLALQGAKHFFNL